jgi:hypothetical protein
MQEDNRGRDNKPSPESGGSKFSAASEPVPPEDFLQMVEWIRQAHGEAEHARLHAEPTWDDLQK